MSEHVTVMEPAEKEARRIPRGPAEGWTTVVLAVFIVLVMAWTIDDPAWVNGREALTDPLITMALLGFAFGALGPKIGWGRWTTHGIGAVFAGLLIPIMAGWAMQPDTWPHVAFGLAAQGSAEAYLDIWWRGFQYTSQEVHYIVVLGSLLWATAQFFGYAVFGHHKPLNGVVMVGIVIVGNMASTSRNQLPFLVEFIVASLFLLIAMHAFDERSTWLRRRIGDPSALSSMYLKGGAVFIVLAIAGSLVLTTRAASAPLAGAWGGVDDELISFGQRISRLFPAGPDVRGGSGVTFGDSARILPTWNKGQGVAFTAVIDEAMPELRWRAATYDTFALGAWLQTDKTSVPVGAGEALLAGTPEEPPPDLTSQFSATIEADQFRDSWVLAPGSPVAIDRPANVVLQGDEGSFAGVDLPGDRTPYSITAAVLEFADEAALQGGAITGITGNQLWAASEDYPAEISARYTDVPPDALGPESRELLVAILAEAPDRDPYKLAVKMQEYLKDAANFEYTPNGTGPCSGSAVECFARSKRGYCLHYASTMAILLRAANPANPIPTRLVQGFLPGTRTGPTSVTVEAQSAHAWVEVYFPGYGWIPFDPTGGGVGRQTVIPAGPEVAAAEPTPVPSGPAEPLPSRGPGAPAPSDAESIPTSQPVDRVVLVLLAVLLATVVIGIAVASWMRGPRSEISPDAAWATMLRAASRFGFGPRPTQTVYEYAGSLAELVPVARADLETVADAKVETQYAKVRVEGARLDAVRDATRRLRISLLRLALRRPRRRRRRS